VSGDKKNIIIYNTVDGKASVSLYAKDGMVWMNQSQIAELFDTSVPNISMHISNILKEGELEPNTVFKDYLTTAADGKQYNVTFYADVFCRNTKQTALCRNRQNNRRSHRITGGCVKGKHGAYNVGGF
jgi:hypothetical protein